MATIPWYCTREDVMSAMDSKVTARNTAQVDRIIAASSRTVEKALHRRFYPELATRTFDWPSEYSQPWRLWLNQHELVSVSSLSAGGAAIAASDFFLRPDTGPPYTHIEIDLGSTAAFAAGDTHQRAISITGVFGYSADTEPAGALAEALDASETSVDVTDSAAIGVGHVIMADSERMVVTGKRMVSTGQTIQAALTGQQNAVTVAVSDGTAFAYDEVILVDSERMLVVDIAGNNLTVKRAWDGTVLAAHTGSTIYALRTLTVERGALGTTAATHTSGTALTRHVVPGPVRQMCIAESVNTIFQEQAGYSRQIGTGETARESFARGLKDAREQAYNTYGRKARIRAA